VLLDLLITPMLSICMLLMEMGGELIGSGNALSMVWSAYRSLKSHKLSVQNEERSEYPLLTSHEEDKYVIKSYILTLVCMFEFTRGINYNKFCQGE
jgi:hypothetical protein